MRHPDFDDLVGPEVPAEERARLLRAHEALLAAGPPPDLPPSLAAPRIGRLSATRRRGASLVLAAALVLAAFGAGYAVAEQGTDEAFETDFVVDMFGRTSAPPVDASLVVGVKDDDGNWPMRMTVSGLEALPAGERYELVLTRNGRPAASCGTFAIEDEKTIVYLNAPYPLRRYDGWAITREGDDEILVRTAEI
jgi:hypothetical protein